MSVTLDIRTAEVGQPTDTSRDPVESTPLVPTTSALEPKSSRSTKARPQKHSGTGLGGVLPPTKFQPTTLAVIAPADDTPDPGRFRLNRAS